MNSLPDDQPPGEGFNYRFAFDAQLGFVDGVNLR